MKSATALVLFAFAVSFAQGCRDRAAETERGPRPAPSAGEILADREGAPAANALIRLQEAPAFPVDGQGRPFATIGDTDERSAAASDKPMALEETELRR